MLHYSYYNYCLFSTQSFSDSVPHGKHQDEWEYNLFNMQSAYNFIGNGAPFGALRMMTQFPEASIRNSSHIQELYQNLPQLQKAIYVPATYKTFEVQNTLPIQYADQQQAVSSSPYKLQMNSFYNSHLAKHGHEHNLEKDQVMYKRNGWGGWGDAGHGHQQGKHGNTPALSALALLGFMFFLQLIQNSLQNNRQLLAAAARNATTVGLVVGRGNEYRHEYDIQKRSIGEDQGIHLIAHKDHAIYDTERHRRGRSTDKSTDNHERIKNPANLHEKHNVSSSSTTHQKFERKPKNSKLKNKDNPMDILRFSSIHCCQLIACKIGESIYDNLDTTTGFMIRMLGTTIIPKIPRKTWTGRLLRAIDKGWKKESCDSLYRNCGVLYNLFYNATNTIQARKKHKH